MEIVLGATILALLALLAYERYEGRRERAKLVNALMAKTTGEFRDLELTEKVRPIETPKREESEFMPESELSDEQFKKMIDQEANYG